MGTHHGQVDVARGELHVDLLVDHGLGGGVKVLANLRHGCNTSSGMSWRDWVAVGQCVQVRAQRSRV